MKTLLQINVSVNTGSTGRIAEDIGRRAIESGYESYIAYGVNARESHSRLIKVGTKFGYYAHGIKSFCFDAHGFGSKRATKALVKKIEAIKPDVILLHNIHGYYLNIEVLLTYLAKKSIPVFWTLHDCWPLTGHCSHFMRYNCEKYKSHCYSCPNRKGYPCSLFIDRSKHNYEVKKKLVLGLQNLFFIPVCKWMDRVVADSYAKGFKTKVIYNGVDVATFKPASAVDISSLKQKYQIPDKKIVLGVASTWKKRLAYCDFCWLSENLPEDYMIVLVGMSDEQIKQLPQGIIGIQRTESIQELAILYSLAGVFVNPTYVDNFPTTNIEALACGTPVITYNTGGSPEAIDENTGVVVTKGDKEALKNAIISIVANKDKYTSEVCRKRAVENFNKDDRFEDYTQLFNEAINKK